MSARRNWLFGVVLIGGLPVANCSDSATPAVDPPAPARAVEVSSEFDVERLVAEADRLERECVPAEGVPRTVVEERFGAGTAIRNDKSGADAPADSPVRSYEFCDDGVLIVRFDDDWRVAWAHFANPYAAKGVPLGRELPLEVRVRDAQQRLAQMKRIRDEVRSRFGE